MKKTVAELFSYWRLERSLRRQINQELQAKDLKCSQTAEQQAKHIQNLQELAQAARAASPLRWIEKAAVLVFFLVALVLITFLVFTPVKVTNIETELKVSAATFVLAEDSPVLQPMNVADVQIFDVRNLSTTAPKDVHLEAPEGAVAKIQSVAKESGASTKLAQLSLSGLVLPKGTTIAIKTGEDKRIRFSVTPPNRQDPPEELSLTGRGPLQMFLIGDNTDQSIVANLDSPYPIRIVPFKREFTLDFLPLPNATLELLPQIPISEISFHAEDAESELRQVSAINAGSVIRTELGSEKLKLRPFEPLDAKGCSWEESKRCLSLRLLTMSKDEIVAQFYGNVNKLQAGPSGAERDLMPSRLEWLNSNHHFKVVWTAILFASGLILGLVRWFTK